MEDQYYDRKVEGMRKRGKRCCSVCRLLDLLIVQLCVEEGENFSVGGSLELPLPFYRFWGYFGT